MSKTQSYVQEVAKEMKKVNWPDQKELVSNTVVTIVATAMISLFIFGADRVIAQVLSFIY
ncbi:MAG: preprotein translocase subunit SecE [Bacteroidota bacterium]